MFTIAVLTTISIFWDMVKLGGKASLWVMKWMFIITIVVGMIIPAFLSIYLTMCCISFVIWLIDLAAAKIMERDRRVDRSPFEFSKNWKRLTGATCSLGDKIEKRQASGSNEVYVVRSKNLAKATPVRPASRPITLDEIILCDVLLDD